MYATFDDTRIWKSDKIAFGLLRMCDGKKTFKEIVEILAKRIFHKSDIRSVIEKILKELTELKFVELV